MNAPRANQFYERSLRQAIQRLREEGWSVEIQPREIAGLERFSPDYVARRGDELIVGEVKFRGQSDLGELEKLTRAVEGIPGARVEMTWLGKSVDEPRVHDVVKMAETARSLGAEYGPAALLLAWAALDGALAVNTSTQEEERLHGRMKTARQKLNEMASLGELSEAQFARLDEAAHIRNSIAHGIYIEPPLELIDYVSNAAIAIARGVFTSIESMTDWFFENYKEPAEGVPFDTREGGYQYIAGGPFDAEDVLNGMFNLMPEGDIREAVREIEEGGNIEWVRRCDY